MTRRLSCRAAAAGLVLSSSVAHAAGSVSVRSDVEGQSISIDGADIGMVTPATVDGLSAGRHVVQVAGGCRFGVAAVQVADGKTVPVVVETRSKPGSLVLQVAPPDAEVRVDGEVLSNWQGAQSVACGTHTVSVSKQGHLPLLINVDVEAGQALELPLTLVAQGRGELTLDVSPDEASVYLDGGRIGQGDVAGLVLPAGPHTIRIEADGHEAREQQFVLEDGANLVIEVPLTALPESGNGSAGLTGAVSTADLPAAPAGPSVWPTSRIAGVSLAAGGAGLGVLAAVQLSRMTAYGAEYRSRADEVLATNDASVLPPAYANDYRTDTLLPQRNRAVATSTLAASLLAAGLTLTVAF